MVNKHKIQNKTVYTMLEQQELVVPIRKDFVDCLSQQISEYELLKSMYPNNGDIILSDKSILEDIISFVNGDTEYVPNNLEFVINLIINELKLEVCVNLPVTYPNKDPDIYIRCNQLNRQQESLLNAELASHIKLNHNGDVCIYTIIDWLQDNTSTIVSYQSSAPVKIKSDTDQKISDKEQFTRLWIYSHHIYNKKKREEITKRARELKLSGFCLPGKPGVICIEGDDSSCKEWWQDIKSMTWKKIMIRKMESFEPDQECSFKKFNSFEELHFQSSTNTKHTNMSEFSKFMSKHGCSDIFSEFFGLHE